MGIVEDLEAAIDIVELVGRYTKLKKAGTNYKSLCPFPGHNEKTPSFVVSPTKQIGYCFGCHRGGGVVKFVMDVENCSFKEAINILGSITGIETNVNFDPEKFEAKKNMFSLYKDATNYYKNALTNYPKIKKYLYDRGLDEQIIQNFSIGYSDSGIELYNHLKKKGYDDQQILDSHIFLDTRSKKDKFIGRIIFPVQNNRGDFVAFAGRIVDKGEPKYLNSPASNIYDKSNILYNFFNARQTITKDDFVIVCEGYMDVIALTRGGIMNAVAVSGTALTQKHLKLIKRLTKKVYLCFDGDNAGERATRQSLEKMKNEELEVKIINLPKGKDPDEIVSAGKNFHEYIKNALTPIAYYMQKSKFDPTSLDDKKKLLVELLQIIHSYTGNVERDYFLREVAILLNIRENVVYDAFNKVKVQRGKQETESTTKETITAEDIIISYLITDEKLIDTFVRESFLPESYGKYLQKILEKGKQALDGFELEKKEYYKGLALKLEIQNEDTSAFHKEERFKKSLFSLNKELFEKQQNLLKQKMKTDDSALIAYTKLISEAKKRGLK